MEQSALDPGKWRLLSTTLPHGRGEIQAAKDCARSHSEGQNRAQLLPLGLSWWCQLWALSPSASSLLPGGMATGTNTGPSDLRPFSLALFPGLCFSGLILLPALPLPLKSNLGSS